MTLLSWPCSNLERFVSLNSLYSVYSEMLSSQSLHFDELMLSFQIRCQIWGGLKGEEEGKKKNVKKIVIVTDNYLHIVVLFNSEHLEMKNVM